MKYVIFVFESGFEVIEIENIPELLKLLPWEFNIYPIVVENRETICAQNIAIKVK